MKLVIISHTEHYKSTEGKIVGWAPTINEINHLAPHFETITHLAMLHNSDTPPSTNKYTAGNINFVALPVLGGKGLSSKLKTIIYIPNISSISLNTWQCPKKSLLETIAITANKYGGEQIRFTGPIACPMPMGPYGPMGLPWGPMGPTGPWGPMGAWGPMGPYGQA